MEIKEMTSVEANYEELFHRRLRRQAKIAPDKAFLKDDVQSLTYLDADCRSDSIAKGLADRGVALGDTVAVMMPSSIDYVLVWLATMKLGAVLVPVNDSYKGNMLLRQLNDSASKIMIIHGSITDRIVRLADKLVDLQSLVVVEGQENSTISEKVPWSVTQYSMLYDSTSESVDSHVNVFDPMAIFYTSGTTGPSKGVIYSHGQGLATAKPFANELDESDIFYMTNPMFHVALPHLVGAVILAGATVVVRKKFSIKAFWPDIEQHKATVTLLLGTTPSYVSGYDVTKADFSSLKKVFMVPVLQNAKAFCEKFDVRIMTWFNMTEVSTPLHSHGFHIPLNQSCGRVRDGVEARVVDEHDAPVSTGQVGELVIRSERPWELNLGYWRNSEATVRAWRNQWVHTGDLFRVDNEGNYFFVDRLKDSIRKGGENISSFEVESEVLEHPAVAECAALAVPSVHGEDEILIVVALDEKASLKEEELMDFLQPRMPYFMIPRYIKFESKTLPKTPTGKIQKSLLRERGSDDCWDRQEAGYVISR